MGSIFTKIVNGEIPCHKVAETEDYLAFLDINPNSKGHTLCIPKKEVDYLFDLDENTYSGLMTFSKKVAAAIDKTVSSKRIGMSVIGLEVPHVHVHLIPLNSMEDARFTVKTKMSQEELADLASRIMSNFELS